MLRLIIPLCAALYALMVIYSETAPDLVAAAPVSAPSETESARARMDRLTTSDGAQLPIAAVITSSDVRVASQTQIAVFQTPSAAQSAATRVAASASNAAPAPERPMVQVTGSQVNLREGPSTADPVVTALTSGARAELIGLSGDGWALIRAVDTGVEGYMADRFLAAAE